MFYRFLSFMNIDLDVKLCMMPSASYRIRKKFRSVFNFVFFADDKDPRNFFH